MEVYGECEWDTTRVGGDPTIHLNVCASTTNHQPSNF
jgi:hypothetical protein